MSQAACQVPRRAGAAYIVYVREVILQSADIDCTSMHVQARTYRSACARTDGRHVIAHGVEENGPIRHGGDLATGRSAEKVTTEAENTSRADA